MPFSIGNTGDTENAKLMEMLAKGAIGAFPHKSKVIKTSGGTGDFATIGDTGVIEGSVALPEDISTEYNGKVPKYLYLVSWDHDKDSASLIVDLKIDKL